MGDETRESDRAPGGEGLASDEVDEFGGDPVCWAHLLCWDCGVVLTPGVVHRRWCQAVDGALAQPD